MIVFQQILHDSINVKEYAAKDKRKLLLKRIGVNAVVIAILALALWAIAATVTKYSSDIGTLRGARSHVSALR